MRRHPGKSGGSEPKRLLLSDYYIRQLRSKLIELDNGYTSSVKSGAIADFPTYKYLCGKIAAISEVVNLIEEIERERE